MKNMLLFLLLSFFMCSNVFAHQDKIITCENGKLIGLPKKYQPAEFDLNSYRLRINNRVINISQSAYLNSLFPENKEHDLIISASWYHDESRLPPYLLIQIKPFDKDFSYRILFNMDTLDVIDITVVLKTSSTSRRHMDIKLSERQMKSIMDEIQIITEQQGSN